MGKENEQKLLELLKLYANTFNYDSMVKHYNQLCKDGNSHKYKMLTLTGWLNDTLKTMLKD